MELNVRLKEARKFLNLSQVRVARENNTFQKTISDIENGKVANIPNDYILFFYKKGISLEWLYSGLGNLSKVLPTVGYETKHVSSGSPEGSRNLSSKQREPVVLSRFERFGKGNILAVTSSFQLEYVERFEEAEFVNRLPSYRLPGLGVGEFRMFEVRQNSMAPTIRPGDMLVCEKISDPSQMMDDLVYVLLTKKDLVVSRVVNRLSTLDKAFLVVDHPSAYHPEYLSSDELLEVWKVRSFMSSNMPDPSEWNQRISSLEKRVVRIESDLKVKE